MRTVLVTQRVDVHPVHGERRDGLDQRWTAFCRELDLLPVLVPNDASLVASLWDAVQPTGVVLTGGNDLVAVGGDAPERDGAEERLLQIACERGAPVIGICRGMQLLVQRSGGTLAPIAGHVATRHALQGAVSREVNSFHLWGVREVGPGWEVLARSADGFIELARQRTWRQLAVMWHPERESPFHPQDIEMFRSEFAASGRAGS